MSGKIDETAGDGAPTQPDAQHVEQQLIGTMLGAYRIERLLGEGAMGEVFLATHVALHRPVALKTLKPAVAADRSLTERFFAEARAVNIIRHENIVECTDLVNDPAGRSYIVMELLEGATLGGALRGVGRMPASRVAHIATQIADAIGAAHAKGIVHRDLKPENIFLIKRSHSNDYVKVLDFGIARLRVGGDAIAADGVHGDVSTTQSGVLIGTPAYMSPEQVRGETAGPGADIYALGVLMFQMLTGRLPFEVGAMSQMLAAQLRDTPPRVDELVRDVPTALADLVARALAKDPAARPADMAALRRELLLAAGGDDTSRTLDEPAPEIPPAVADEVSSTEPTVHAPVAEPLPPPRRMRWWHVAVPLVVVAGIGIAIAATRTTATPSELARLPDEPTTHRLDSPRPAIPVTAPADAMIDAVMIDAVLADAPPVIDAAPRARKRVELPQFGDVDLKDLPAGFACAPGRAFDGGDVELVLDEIKRKHAVDDRELDAAFVAAGTTRAKFRARVQAHFHALGCWCPSTHSVRRDDHQFATCGIRIPANFKPRVSCAPAGKPRSSGGGCSCGDGYENKLVDGTYVCAKL